MGDQVPDAPTMRRANQIGLGRSAREPSSALCRRHTPGNWPNIAMGLSQVALVACAAGSCVMITTVASGHKPAVTRRFAIAQYSIAAVIAAVSLVTGQQYEMAPQEYLEQNVASSWLLPLLLYVPLALTLVSWAAMRYSSR